MLRNSTNLTRTNPHSSRVDVVIDNSKSVNGAIHYCRDRSYVCDTNSRACFLEASGNGQLQLSAASSGAVALMSANDRPYTAPLARMKAISKQWNRLYMLDGHNSAIIAASGHFYQNWLSLIHI